MIRIRGFKTGTVKITYSQIVSDRRGGILEVLSDRNWSEWLPITAWLIEHPEGLILVDTGETARTSLPGYLPRYHPYFRRAVQFDVKPEEEIGPQLERSGFNLSDIRHILLTHLHTDHAGGLEYFPNSTIWVDEPEFRSASGMTGRINGYLNRHWPAWFSPDFYHWTEESFGPFKQCARITSDGAVTVVPTPGHSAGHVSVIVSGTESRSGEPGDRPVVLAGDLTDATSLMHEGRGGALLTKAGFRSLAMMKRYVDQTSAVVLPAHEIGVLEKLSGTE